MEEKVEIKTEGEFLARFDPTSEIVDAAYFRAYDALSTTNSVIYLISGVVAVLFAFLVFYSSSRLQNEKQLSFKIFGWPMVAFGLLALFFTSFIFYFSVSSNQLMTRIVPFFVLLLVGVVLLFGFLEQDQSPDQWEIGGFQNPGGGAYSLQMYLAVGLTFFSLVVCWINSKLRADRLHFLGTGYLSFMVSAFFLTFGMMYVANYVLQQIRSSDLSEKYYLPIYAVGGLATFVGILVADSFAVFLVNAATNFGKNGDYAAAAPELANATYRSRQMVISMFFLVVFLTFALVYWFRDGLVDEVNGSGTSGTAIVVAALVTLPILTLGAAGAMELRMGLPSLYFMLSNIMIGYIFFVIGVQLVPWQEETVYGTLGLLATIALLYLLSGNMGSNLSVVSLIAVTFMLVKWSGKIVIEKIGDGASDGEKLALLGLPLLVFTGVWLFRSYWKGDSYSVPFTLLVFSIVYILGYFDKAVATRSDYILAKDDRFANLGLDWVLVTAVLMGVTSLGAFSETQVDFIQRVTGNEKALATGTIVKSVLNVLLGVGGAALYNFLQTDAKVNDYLRESQEKAERVWVNLKEDLST